MNMLHFHERFVPRLGRIASLTLAALLVFTARTTAAIAIYQDGLPDPFAGGTYTGTQDTMLVTQGGSESDNFGARFDWDVGRINLGGTGHRHTLLRFNISSMAGQFTSINSITLELTVNFADGAADTLQIFRLATANTGWIEGTACCGDGTTDPGMSTWLARVQGSAAWAGSQGASTPGVDYVNTLIGSQAYSNTLANGTVLSITITDPTLISDWAAGGNAGLFLRAQNEIAAGSRVNIYSADWTTVAQRPKLIIDYVPEPGTAALSALGLVLLARRRRK